MRSELGIALHALRSHTHTQREREIIKATAQMRGNLHLVSFFSLYVVVVFFVERLPRPTTALTSAHRENAFIGYSEKKQSRCVDPIQMCSDWAKNGECAKNPGYMSENCCCGASFFVVVRLARLCVCFFYLSLFALSGRVFFCSVSLCVSVIYGRPRA